MNPTGKKSAPKKVLRKRNKVQSNTIASMMTDIERLSEENSRLTRENLRYAEFVKVVHNEFEFVHDADLDRINDEFADVIERAGA